MVDNEKISAMQDRELVALFKEGSQAAMEQLYLRYRNVLINLCLRYLKNTADAEDVVHDIFMQLWENPDVLNEELSFSGYVKTLAINRVLHKFRQFDIHERFAQHILMNTQESTNETEDTIIDNDYAELLDKLIETLSPQQKEIFRLNRLEGLTYQEISELLQISVKTVRNHISLALKKIKKQLSQHTDINIQILTAILLLLA